MQISLLAGNAAVNAVTALINAGTPPGLFKVFTGSAPATPETADSGTLLYSTTFSNTSFGAAANGTAAANAIAATTASNTGTAGYWRAYNAAGTCIMQGSVGTAGADINFNTLAFVSGQTVTITSLSYTQPSV